MRWLPEKQIHYLVLFSYRNGCYYGENGLPNILHVDYAKRFPNKAYVKTYQDKFDITDRFAVRITKQPPKVGTGFLGTFPDMAKAAFGELKKEFTIVT